MNIRQLMEQCDAEGHSIISHVNTADPWCINCKGLVDKGDDGKWHIRPLTADVQHCDLDRELPEA
jgi:hypothetical protein